MRRRKTLSVVGWLAAASLLAHAGEARAELPPAGGSVLGADVDVPSRGALTAGIGWPSTYVRYDFATAGRFGIGLRSDLYWGHPAYGFRTGFGWSFDVPMRIQVMDRAAWAVAIALTPGVFLGFDDHWYYDDWWHDRDEDVFIWGPRFGAGVIVSVRPRRFLTVFFGLRSGVDVTIVSPEHHDAWVDVDLPIRPFGGVELAVHRRISIFADVSLGPAISFQSYCVAWERDGDCRDWDRDVDAYISGHFYTGAVFFFGS